MSKSDIVFHQLNEYKRKFWLVRLAKGLMVFAGTGLLFVVSVALIEYAWWLSQWQRGFVFFITLTIEMGLLVFYVLYPLFQLLFGKTLTDERAAIDIGRAMVGVDDRLLNFLQLKKDNSSSDLIDASIEQKAVGLSEFSFKQAIQWRSIKPYTLFLVPLILVITFLFVDNGWNKVALGSKRLVFFNQAFEKSLPFEISLLSELKIEEGEDYTLVAEIKGDVLPERISVQTNREHVVLTRMPGGLYQTILMNCLNDIQFRFKYDDIFSEVYTLRVLKYPILGKVVFEVFPPAYTGITPFSVENVMNIEVPQHSRVEMHFFCRNAENLSIQKSLKGVNSEEVSLMGGRYSLKAVESVRMRVKADGQFIGESQVQVIKDYRPQIALSVDSVLEGIDILIRATDEYGINKADLVLTSKMGLTESIRIPHSGVLLQTQMRLSFDVINQLSEAWVEVSDQIGTTRAKVNLTVLQKPERSMYDLLNSAGESLREMVQDEKSNQKSKSSVTKGEQRKSKAKELMNVVKELNEKDSVNYERLLELSERLLEMAKKMDKQLPINRHKISEKEFEETLKRMEKEWALLKTIDKLQALEKHLDEKAEALKEQEMTEMKKVADELQKVLKEEGESDKIEWQKFDELEKKNQKLEEVGKEHEGDQDLKEKDQENEGKKKKDNLIKEMKETSQSLREQLGNMSDMMSMDETQENIELLRRLQIRALKTSKNQEEIYRVTGQSVVEKVVYVYQREINQSASAILDSLSLLNVSDPQLGQILMDHEKRLDEHLGEIKNVSEENPSSFKSAQRYLQYSLNDLAAILYDILKSENENMQNMSGEQQCKNPKPGKGKKGKMSEQQMMLGEKMKPEEGKEQSEGKKGEAGKGQTLGQEQLLEIIKGQEEILRDFQKEHGNKPGSKDVMDEMNHQLDDLINENLDRAMIRNKSIQEKLIAYEKSINKKEEREERRESRENSIDYEFIRQGVLQDYLRSKQKSQGVVNLPALKNYYSGKWIRINAK